MAHASYRTPFEVKDNRKEGKKTICSEELLDAFHSCTKHGGLHLASRCRGHTLWPTGLSLEVKQGEIRRKVSPQRLMDGTLM